MGKVPKGAIKGPDNRFLKNPDGSYVVRGQATVDLKVNTPPAAPPDPLAVLAALGITPEALRRALGMSTPSNPGGTYIPPGEDPSPSPSVGVVGSNLYEILPLAEALKEALFDLGATDRLKNAVRTSKLAEHLILKGFGVGRALLSVAYDLRDLADSKPKGGAAQQGWPLIGWVHYVGGGPPKAPDNWEWSIAPDALAKRPVEPAPAVEAAGPVMRPALAESEAAYAEDLLPGSKTAAEILATMEKKTILGVAA